MVRKLNQLWYSGLRKMIRQYGKRVRQTVKDAARHDRGKTPAKGPVKTISPAGTWTSGSLGLRYRLYLPPAAAPGIPMIIMLHGCEQDASQFSAGTRMDRLASRKGYALLYPEQSAVAHPRRCWKWYEPSTQQGTGTTEAIARIADAVASKHLIDRRRIYACGISAGAAMAHILALNHPELVAAVGMHSGPVFGACRNAAGAFKVMQHGGLRPEAAISEWMRLHPPMRPIPAILISGTDDRIVRAVNLRQLERQFIHLNQAMPLAMSLIGQPLVEREFGRRPTGALRKLRMKIKDHRAGRKLMVRSVEIEGLGHAWSGGDEGVRFNAKGPDASRMMLEFFARHQGGSAQAG